MSCNICCEKYNKSKNSKIDCMYCQFDACRVCCETYILSETTPKCMNKECGKEWTRKFLCEKFTKVFINSRLKKHKEEVMFQSERALLPATQPLIEIQIEKEKTAREIDDLNEQIAALTIKRNRLRAHFVQLSDPTPSLTRKEFVRACPEPECRGFLSTQWKCGLCEKWTCPDCHVVKGLERNCEHECNKDDLATAQLLSKDTKPCPKCATGIFKIEGCDQMFCTQCHTPFSWRTGLIASGNIHNPHYFEWMRRNGGEAPRNPHDVVCGRELDRNFVYRFSRNHSKFNMDENMANRILEMIRLILHTKDIEMQAFDVPENNVNLNVDLRIQYMRGKLTEADFKTKIQRNHKKNEKKREFRDIMQMYINTSTDIIYRLENNMQNKNPQEKTQLCNTAIAELKSLTDYSNECMAIVSKTYDCAKNLTVISSRSYINLLLGAGDAI